MSSVVIIMCLLFGQQINSEFLETEFKVVQSPNVTVLPNGTDIATRGLMECSSQCLANLPACQTFLYQPVDQQCIFGWVVVPSPTPLDPVAMVIYSRKVLCDVGQGFQVITRDSTSVCVWVPASYDNYINARNTCRAKHAHLYTPRTTTKLDIMVSVLQTGEVWIGLTDMVKEGTFVWEDDGTAIDTSWKQAHFCSGEPNGNTAENCGTISLSTPCFMDVGCTRTYKYMCEIGEFYVED